MRILVCSDSHGRRDLLVLAYEQQPTAEILVFCGDGADDAQFFPYEDKPSYVVRGNWDHKSDWPLWQEFSLMGKKIIVTHGHASDARHGLDELIRTTKERGADLVLFGHTHRPEVLYVDGMTLFNPGSIADGNYGFVDITAAGIVCQNLKVRQRM